MEINNGHICLFTNSKEECGHEECLIVDTVKQYNKKIIAKDKQT